MVVSSRPAGRLEVKPVLRETENCQPRKKILKKSTEEIKQVMQVQGSHRTLFYRQPSRKHVSSYSTVVVDIEGNSKKVAFESEKQGKKEKPSVVITLSVKAEKMATKGTQTDFRESESQTFPWRHRIQAEGQLLSELLSLDWFTLEKNFPLGLKEVMQIEEAREKLAWEKLIEKLKGKESEMKRKSLVLRLSVNEAAFKVARQEEENRERLEKSGRQMQEMQATFEEQLSFRLQMSYLLRKKENNSKIHRLSHQLSRKIRKVKSAKGRLSTKPDIIAMHQDKSSRLYAPQLRDGENPSLGHEVIDIQCRFLKRFHGLEILEKHLADALHPKFSKIVHETQNSKLKKVQFSFGKFIDVKEPQEEEKTFDNFSLKVAVSPESSATGQTGLPVDE